MKRIVRILAVVSFVWALATATADAAESAPARKLRVAITSLSGSMAVPWLAREAGIFKNTA
jgi:acid phosphatase class B